MNLLKSWFLNWHSNRCVGPDVVLIGPLRTHRLLCAECKKPLQDGEMVISNLTAGTIKHVQCNSAGDGR